MATGGCLCGRVRYQTDAPLRDVVFCHCQQCRRQTGLYYAATAVPWASLAITGDEHLTWYAASDFARRGFCGTCGFALFWKPNQHDHVAILAGSLDDTTNLRAACHIFAEDRMAFCGIDDGLPHYPRDAPGLPVDPE